MLINYRVIILGSLLFVAACGSSSSTKDSSPTENLADDSSSTATDNTPIVIDVPSSDTDSDISLIDITCNGIAKLPIISASATADLTNYSASNVIDENFMAMSRWSAEGEDQSLTLTLNQASQLKGLAITWLNEDKRTYSYSISVSKDNINWEPTHSERLSNELSTRSEFIEMPSTTAKFIKITTTGNNIDNTTHIVETEAFGCQENISSSIELNDWYLSIPVDENLNTKALSIYEEELNNNYINTEFFFTSIDNGLVFRSPIEGAKTSTNTKYTRTELREMLRSGNTSINTKGVNKNNWVFSSAPEQEQQLAGGVDGTLRADLAVNYVTTTGDADQVGRVIIGQIHANDDEPIRVYYRKLPHNSKGSIYVAHEIHGGDDIYFELIGTRSKSADNPTNGIALNERFSYQISVVGNQLTFVLFREGKADISQIIDMSESGYNIAGEYMYFKAGVYNQNNTGDAKDYVQATFYTLENTHND